MSSKTKNRSKSKTQSKTLSKTLSKSRPKSRSKTLSKRKSKSKSLSRCAPKTISRRKPGSVIPPKCSSKTLSKSKRISKSKGKSKSKRKSKSKSKRNLKRTVSLSDARKIGTKLGIDFNSVKLSDYRYGMNVEFEHGKENKLTNVTNNNLLVTGKIALAHLLEYPDYYNRLRQMERVAEKYWKNKKKPSILI